MGMVFSLNRAAFVDMALSLVGDLTLGHDTFMKKCRVASAGCLCRSPPARTARRAGFYQSVGLWPTGRWVTPQTAPLTHPTFKGRFTLVESFRSGSLRQ
jgi:hypothetical protein